MLNAEMLAAMPAMKAASRPGDGQAQQAVGQHVAHQQQQRVVVGDALAGGAAGGAAAVLEVDHLLHQDGGDHARAR